MKLTDEIYEVFKEGVRFSTFESGVQAVLDLLDPVPANVDKVHDRGERCWRRSIDDPAVWTTAARSSVATGRVLLDRHGPLKWRDANGNEDFIVKLTDEKGTNE
jgi:hypothetical protein